jgi:hypothetical protein
MQAPQEVLAKSAVIARSAARKLPHQVDSSKLPRNSGTTSRDIVTGPTSGHSLECDMIGVFVILRYGDNFDERAVRKVAETARAMFE